MSRGSSRLLALLVAAFLSVAGGLALSLPVHDGRVRCGSALTASELGAFVDRDGCRTARQNRLVLGYAGIAVGATMAFATPLVLRRRRVLAERA